jgi:ectoine hydroxylase-related dioxygenase (phytanoyl-CoA dioxygenase family)
MSLESHQISIQLTAQGFAVIESLLSVGDCQSAITQLRSVTPGAAGNRNLLSESWCATLARRLAAHPLISQLLAPNAVCAQCTLFEKTPQRNWLVAWHQDLSIPVAYQVHDPAVTGWSRKEGVLYAQPTSSLVSQLLAVRLQLDDCTNGDGALHVVGGSHRHGRISVAQAFALRDKFGETRCAVPVGGALLMRPLLLHASSKLAGIRRRRVLHFLFGPDVLPFGLRWANPV